MTPVQAHGTHHARHSTVPKWPVRNFKNNLALVSGWKALTYLPEQFIDRFASVDDLERTADRAHVFLLGIDLQRLADRAEEVGRGDRVMLDRRAVVGRL